MEKENNNKYNITDKDEDVESWISKKWNLFKFYSGYYYDNCKPYIRLSFEFSKILIGCLLFIFIPQLCEGPDAYLENIMEEYHINITNIANNNIQHVCTFQDNFYQLNNFKIFVICWNFLTLSVFLVNFIFEIIRERYLRTHFEYTTKNPLLELSEIIQNHDNIRIKKDMQKSYDNKTKLLYYFNYACLFMILTNIIFSSIMIYYYYYNGFRSITGLFTSVILIFQKLYNNYDILNLSLNEKYILSTTLIKPHEYNTLEPSKFKQNEYIKKENPSKSYHLYYVDTHDKYILITNDHISVYPEDDNNDKNKLKDIRKQIKNKIKKDKNNDDDLNIEILTQLFETHNNNTKYKQKNTEIQEIQDMKDIYDFQISQDNQTMQLIKYKNDNQDIQYNQNIQDIQDIQDIEVDQDMQCNKDNFVIKSIEYSQNINNVLPTQTSRDTNITHIKSSDSIMSFRAVRILNAGFYCLYIFNFLSLFDFPYILFL